LARSMRKGQSRRDLTDRFRARRDGDRDVKKITP
jgi:hypothetical protein